MNRARNDEISYAIAPTFLKSKRPVWLVPRCIW